MKDSTIRTITMIGIWVAVILLIVVIISLIKNVDEIKSDPILYGMDKHNFNYCSCLDEKGISTIITIDRNESEDFG